METHYVLEDGEKLYDKDQTVSIIKDYLNQMQTLNGQNRKTEKVEIVV
jgi:hypothetical protein